MKKFLLIFIVLQLSLYGYAQSPTAGQLKVTIVSFKCINQSWDGLIEFDGHGNEVSVNFSYRIYSPANPGAARRGVGGTPIFGSNINGMTRAGTQTPDLGGIKNGDVVNISQLIMDDHINADEYIIIAPTLWEWDVQGSNTFNSFNVQLENDLDWAIAQTYPFANTVVSYSEPFDGRVIKISDKYRYGQAIKYHNIFANFLCPLIGQGSKPVDVRSGAFNNQCLVVYSPTLLVLDTRALSALASNNYSASQTSAGRLDKPNFITGINIPFIEDSYAIETSNGSYSVFLKIEFIPDVPVTAPTPASPTLLISRPAKTVNIIKQDLPDRNIKAANIATFVSGAWTGTQTNDNGLYPQNIAFELKGNGEFLVKDNIGTLAAKGTYTFSNNIINGSYKQFSSGETFSFTGTFDPATQKLSCTQGSGTATTGQGKWIATKK